MYFAKGTQILATKQTYIPVPAKSPSILQKGLDIWRQNVHAYIQ
jgi:hypothetical protein